MFLLRWVREPGNNYNNTDNKTDIYPCKLLNLQKRNILLFYQKE
jgi:hypothetical protein